MIVVPHHVSALYVGVCGLGLALACGAGVSREELVEYTFTDFTRPALALK